jgi:hypothetical protein
MFGYRILMRKISEIFLKKKFPRNFRCSTVAAVPQREEAIAGREVQPEDPEELEEGAREVS